MSGYLRPSPSTPIFTSLTIETNTEVRCAHPRLDELGWCADCGICFHRRIFREDAGSRNEIQVCGGCGEERRLGGEF